MRDMIGCSGIIAGVAFLIGIIGSLFATKASFGERLMLAFMPAIIAFIAAMMLCAKDYWQHASAMWLALRRLLARPDVNEQDFLERFPDADPALIVQVREAISRFFSVSVQKIHPADNLQKDFRFDVLDPGFHFFVVDYVLNARSIAPQSFIFKTNGLTDIADFMEEIQCVLDGFDVANRERLDDE